VPAFASSGSVAPFAMKTSCPMYFPVLFSQILVGNLFEEYITSYSSIFVVVTKILTTISYHSFLLKWIVNNFIIFLFSANKLLQINVGAGVIFGNPKRGRLLLVVFVVNNMLKLEGLTG
jgi:hypothetical protein